MQQGGWVYIMTNGPNGILYIGVTSNLPQRIWQHREGVVEGFTEKYGLKRLVYIEPYPTIQEAIAREKAMKKWNRAWKVRQIERNNPDWEDLFWDALERFCKRLAATRGENQAPNQRTILGRLFEGISHQKSLRVTSPIENCPAYFCTVCETLCKKAHNQQMIESWDDGSKNRSDPPDEPTTHWPYREILQDAMKKLGDTCQKLLTARFSDNIKEPELLSALVDHKVAPGSIPAKLTNCKAQLRRNLRGFDYDSI